MANDTAAAFSSSSSSSSAAAVEAEAAGVDDVIFREKRLQQEDDDDDSCSICLEPFSSHNPPSVTKCKHEYHLQCILEWCQRSKECPICWQLLVLNDPSSQELLAAVEGEKNARQIRVVHEVNYVAPYLDDSDFEEPIIWHLTSTSRARRRRRQIISEIDPSEILPSVPVRADTSNLQQINSSWDSNVEATFSAVDSPTSGTHSSISSVSPSIMAGSSTTNTGDCPAKPRILLGQSPSNNSRRSSSSELLAFKDNIKSKFFAASARCKESISRGTHGFREKLLARNDTVKELSREVQREMSAGIAGVARMIDRLDLTSIRTGVSGPLSTSNSAGEGVQDNITRQNSSGNNVEPTNGSSSDVPSHVSIIFPTRPKVALAQSRE